MAPQHRCAIWVMPEMKAKPPPSPGTRWWWLKNISNRDHFLRLGSWFFSFFIFCRQFMIRLADDFALNASVRPSSAGDCLG